MEQSKASLILTIVNRGFADTVMEAARKAGAAGGTIINARGTGTVETEKIFGITIEPEKEIVLIITENATRSDIMKEIAKAAGLATKGSGISISLPVDDILGTSLNNS